MSSIEDSLENHEVPTTKWDEITRSVEANCDSSTAIINKAVQEISMYEEFISPRRSILEARKLEKAFHVSSKLVQSRHKWIDETLLQKPLYSPTNSISSQCTSLSRARSAIEGRRKSRAAAKARASAVMDELQNSKNIAREAAKERAWEALAEIQRSRSLCSRGSGVGSMRSASHEEPDERRQPISSTGSTTLIPVEELREEVEENGVVNVITVGKDEKSENRRHDRPKPDHDDKTKKVRDKGHKKVDKKTPNVKRTRDRKSRSITNKNVQTSNEQGLQGYKKDGSNSFGTLRKEPSSNFLLSDEALMAVSRAALEVAPKVDTFQPSQSQHDSKTAKLTRNNDPSNHKEPYSKRLNVFGAACDTAGSMESNKAYKKTVRSSPNSISLPSEDARTAVSQEALDVTLKFNELRTLRKELRYKEQVKGGVEELIALKDVVSSNQVVANNYNSTLSEKHFDGMASVNNTTSSAKQTLSFLDLKSKNDLTQHRNMPPIDLAKSEASYDELLSSSSSSSDNEQIDIKQVETEDSMREGALDKTMYQGKSLELKNDSDDSADSSYSSAHSQMSSINKSMGPIWQKAIDDAHRARLTRPLSPLKSESTTQVLLQSDFGEPPPDDETLFNVRTSFHHDRMKCAGECSLTAFGVHVTIGVSSNLFSRSDL
ncbi:hypothetical protein ACHAWX_007480 [Stephanocyclus meneghinianus]